MRASDGDGKFLLQLCVCREDGKRVRMDGISRNVIFIDSSLLPLHTRSPVVDQIPNRISNWRDWREGKKREYNWKVSFHIGQHNAEEEHDDEVERGEPKKKKKNTEKIWIENVCYYNNNRNQELRKSIWTFLHDKSNLRRNNKERRDLFSFWL